MLGVGHELYQESKRLGRSLKVREAIAFLENRDKDAADKLRALGPAWVEQPIQVRGFGKIRSVRLDRVNKYPGAGRGQRDEPYVRIDAQ